jgi:carbamoyl-phosphate synthase small subunit
MTAAQEFGTGQPGPFGSAVLMLEDGRAFPGRAFGARGTALGEAVFTTGMTG